MWYNHQVMLNGGFILKGIVLGIALAMDAFSVSVVNGLSESGMSRRKTYLIPFTFAFFQFLMPLTGWFFVTEMVELIEGFRGCIPIIAFILLLFIGGKMIFEALSSLKNGNEEDEEFKLDLMTLILQGIATSIDALSVGFTIPDQDLSEAVLLSVIIAIVTFFICIAGIVFGKKIGSRISHGAGIIGGTILIIIGIKIIIQGL